MEYIDKSIPQNVQKAHSLLSDFLSRCMKDGFTANDDLYQKMKSDRANPQADTTYNILRRQLLSENQGRCCYCMRRIEESQTTLEHVIPNKTETELQYDSYQPYYTAGLWRTMVFAKKFLANPCWPYVAFPHTVAYENLLPSCNGKFARTVVSPQLHAPDDRISQCCNNKRGNEMVIPFVFNPSMVSEFKYHKNGIVVWTVPDHITGDERKRLLQERKKTIDHLGLNCPELVAIRRIWFFLSALGKDCDQAERDRTVLYLTEDQDLTDGEKNMLANFWQSSYWCLLEEYRYFNEAKKFS